MKRFYGLTAQLISGIIGLIFTLLITGSQISVIDTISKVLLGNEFHNSVYLFGTLVVLYSAIGGMRAVSWTDLFQMIVVLTMFGWVTQSVLLEVRGPLKLFKYLSANAPEKLDLLTHARLITKIKGSLFWGLTFSYVLHILRAI